MAMTAHVVYTAWDAHDFAASLSPKVIGEIGVAASVSMAC